MYHLRYSDSSIWTLIALRLKLGQCHLITLATYPVGVERLRLEVSVIVMLVLYSLT